MKKFTLKNLLISFMIVVCMSMAGVFCITQTSHKAYAESGVETNSIEWKQAEGNVPYALYTTIVNESDKYVNYDNDKYILLSTDTQEDLTLYNTTINVRFNRQKTPAEMQNESTVTSASLNVNATLNGNPIVVNKTDSNIEDAFVNYQISLRNSTPMYWNDGNLTSISTEERVGQYVFTFTYRYTLNGIISDLEHSVTISFNVLNKYDYFKDDNAYTILNADLGSGVDNPADPANKFKNYAYNFNKYSNDGTLIYPAITYNANIFALNYTYTLGNASYYYVYKSFSPTKTISEIQTDSVKHMDQTGIVTFEQVGSGSTFSIPTYKFVRDTADGQVVDPYKAIIEMDDFGDYKFGVDLLTATSFGYSIIDLPQLQNSEIIYLTIYGYEMTYKDQTSNTYKTLANDITHADIAGSNSVNGINNTSGSLPTLHPITDQAPIRFNYNVSSLTSGKYRTFSTITEAKNEIYTQFMNEDRITFVDNLYSASFSGKALDYHQTDKFDMDGVYVVKLDYTTNTSYGITLEGTQLFFFEINNTAPITLFQTVDESNNIENLSSIFTNKNIRILVKNNENAFNAPVTLTYTRYENYDSTITENAIPLTQKVDSSGTPVSVEYNGENYYVFVVDNTKEYALASTANGRYIITITYSPSRLKTNFEYFIDSTPITNIKIYDVTSASNNTETYYTLNPDKIIEQQPNSSSIGYDMSITNNAFSLNWSEKKWASYVDGGNTTTVTAYYLPINNTDEDIIYYQVSDGENIEHLVTNGYSIGDVSPIIYSNSINKLNGADIRLLETQYLSANGIYLFYVQDLAGNYFYRLIMLDNTDAQIIQESYNENVGEGQWQNSFDPINNAANFVKTRTRLTFGQYKSIEALGNMQLEDKGVFEQNTFVNLLSETSYFKTYQIDALSKSFVNVPISRLEVTKTDTTNDTGTETHITLNPKEDWRIILYPNTVGGSNDFSGESRYMFNVTCLNGTTVVRNIEMNFDNASGQYYAYGNSSGDSTTHYIMTNTGTNLYNLTFKYINNSEGMYKIAQITYKYYAFNYDSQSNVYPFSQTETSSGKLTLPEIVGDDGYYTITNINQEDGITLPGKYTLTRTYVGGGYIKNEDGSLDNSLGYGEYDSSGSKVSFGNDKFERSYTVYVDHNGIISSTYTTGTTREVGDNISITLGKNTNNEYTFKNFFRSVSDGASILNTNKLPVQINIPVYKYFVDNGSAIDNVMCRLNFATLDVVITYQNINIPYSRVVTYEITEYTAEGYYVIPEFTAEGKYTITISDRTGYYDLSLGKTNIDPTVYSCSFIIQHTAPSGEVYVNDEPMAESTVEENSFATNVAKTGTVDFVWTDAVDPYTASVVEINITANDITQSIDFTQYNIEDLINDASTVIKDLTFIKSLVISQLSSDTFEAKTYIQHKYVLTLNIDEEIDYSIEIRYAPRAVENHGYGDFVSTTYRVKIDRTKPNINIDNLINSDTYLINSGSYSDIEDIKTNFKEENAILSTTTPTIYDYAFSADHTYSLVYDSEETIPEFYFRKYRKYEDENQSLTPDHPQYNDLSSFTNYPRFDFVSNSYGWYEASYQDGVSLSDIIKQVSGVGSVEGFYEIIERDLAGNYRVFTIYFLDFNQNYNVLNIVANGQNGEYVNTNNQEITQLGLFSVSSINSVVGWGTLSVNNLTDTTTTSISYKLTPYQSYDEIYNLSNRINDFTVVDQNTRFNFELKSSAGTSNKYINIVKFEQKLPQPTIVKNSDGTYLLQFPTKQPTSVIYLTHLDIQDEEGTIILNADGYQNIPAKSQNLVEGVYIITYKDNFNTSAYSYTMQLGIEYVSDSEKYIYTNDKHFVATDGTIYAGGDIKVTYQSKVYAVTISTNGENQVSADSYENVYTGVVEGFKSFILKEPTILSGTPANVDVGGQVTYTIYYNDIGKGGVLEKQNFVIYNKLPAINLYDNNNASITGSTSGGSMAITSSAVKINWQDLTNIPHSEIYNPIVLLHTLDSTGQTINSIEINNNRVVTKPGYYMVEICNQVFGNYRTVSFAIQEGDVPFYTVIDNVTKQTLFASNIKLDIVNNYDLGTNRALLEQIKTDINNNADASIRDTLITKVGEAPTQIEQYYSLNDVSLQKDASSELYEYTIKFINGRNVKSSTVANASDYVTTIYLIYGENNPIYANLIAITKVPESSAILTKLNYKNLNDVEVALNTGYETTLTNANIKNGNVVLSWNSLSSGDSKWYNSGNLVYLNYNYNNTNSFNNYGDIANGTSTLTLSGSGKHVLTFRDLAGNVANFSKSNYNYDYFTLVVLDKVIYKVNNSTPLDYMTFNGSVTISLDSDYITYYQNDSLKIYATRNGALYDSYVIGDNNTSFTFTDSGRYVVTLSAQLKNTLTELDTVTYNFTIIERTSARLAYEFNEMLGYEITKVYKDSIDITDRVKEYYIKKSTDQTITQEMLDSYTLKELFVSPDVFGNGNYQITVAVTYNELLAAKEYTFAFKINDAVPIILSNPDYGETTKGKITLTYNPSLIYQQIGKSYLRIYTFNSDTNRFNMLGEYLIDSDSLANTELQTTELTQTNEYFIQLVTDSGNVVTSFRVNRAEPLNTLSIIIIVVVSVVVVVLIIIFIKLRTKMRVK